VKSSVPMNPISYLKTSVIHCEDNKKVLEEIPSDCIDLIYLDPPFFSNRFYEVIWGDEAEVRSFEDRWEGGIQVYTAWMRERMMHLHRVLKPTGTIYLHCDWHASHYLRVMMDDIFGGKRFRNEIIWSYKYGGRPGKDFGRKHDTILRYVKGSKWHFDSAAVRIPHEPASIEHNYRHVDEDGRRYREDNWSGQKSYRYYADEGRTRDDVWADIGSLHHEDKERLGYPTQKPEKLLEVIIRASSKEGDIVLDPFCGCGTAIAVAHRLNRAWLGIDISPTALGIMQRRLEKLGASVDLEGLPVTEQDLRDLRPFEFQNWVIQRINGTHSPKKSNDMGIDGYSFMEQLPVQVKQSDKVGRVTVDNFETAVERAGATKGYIIGFSFTRNAREEVARAKAEKNMYIELVEVSSLIKAPSDKITPELADLFPALSKDFVGLPMPTPRSKAARPTLEELVRSDRAPRFASVDD
jgi:DNA modification methylase